MRAIGRNHLAAIGEVALVCLTLGLALRTFFVQSAQVPTGSMEPTLRGVRVEDLRESPAPLPAGPTRWAQRLLRGYRYVEVPAKVDGRLTAIEGPTRRARSGWVYRCRVGGLIHDVRLPYEVDATAVGLVKGDSRTAGQPLVRCRFVAGDRILLDRVSYNFRAPRRGEVVAFLPDDHLPLAPGRLYLKRLAAFGGETVRIDDHGDVRIESSSSAAGSKGGRSVGRSLNGRALTGMGLDAEELAPAFPDADAWYAVEPGEVLVLGDNAVGSLDGRAWGGFDCRWIWGRVWLVYWPWDGRGLRVVR